MTHMNLSQYVTNINITNLYSTKHIL